MLALSEIAPAFVAMAHRIVWCTVSTVDGANRPRSRVLHPFWEWDGVGLTGWIATMRTGPKKAHLEHSAYTACNYWAQDHDTCLAECRATWEQDPAVKERVWRLFADAPEPLGYDPGGIGVPGWDGPSSPAFSVLRLDPWRVRVLTGEQLATGKKAAVWRG